MPRQGVAPPLVSIVLVTRNGARTLPAVLDALEAQDAPVPFEIVAVDSGSTDGTLEILGNRIDTLVTIPPASFNHGTSRNLGVEHARGDLVVLLVQDATPASPGWLASLTRPFTADAQLAGVFCRQLPRADASAITRFHLARWFASGETPRRVSLAQAADLDRLSPLERLDRCTFDNVCSCIRRSIWQRHPFPTTPIGEDVEWAHTVLRAGYAIAYVPEAAVEHSHERTAAYEFARTYLLHRRLFELFGVRTIPSVPALIRAVGGSAAVHLDCVRHASPPETVRASWRAIALAVAWPAGQYLGALSAARRWSPFPFRGV